MIEEEIITDEDSDTSRKFHSKFFPTVVRSEINFLNLPFFALTKRGLKEKTKTEYLYVQERNGKKVELLWRVIPSTEYGHPTPFDRKVARAIDVVTDEMFVRNGYQLKNPIQFSIYHLVELIGFSPRKRRSGWLYEDIRYSLKRIVATTVESKGSFYLKDKKRWIDRVFHPYEEVIFLGEELNDGTIAETNYLRLHPFYLQNINARYVRPLDYEFLRRLKNDIAGREYEVLSPKFYGLDKRLSYYQVDYQDFCKTLPITPQRYYSATQRQFKKAHEELGSWEYISKVSYVLHKGSQEVKTLRFYLGERAKRERDGELLRREKSFHIKEQLLFPSAEKKAKRTVELIGLAKQLYDRGIKPKRVAIELCENYDDDYIREKIETFDFFMEADDGTITDNPAGWLRTAIETDIEPTKKQVKSSKAAVRQQVEEQVKEMELEKGKIKRPYEEECEGIFEKIIVENAQAVDDAMHEALKQNPILEQFYDVSKPFGDQKGMVQAMTKSKLRERFAFMFKEVDGEYGKKIEKIDKQIAELREGI